MKRTEKPKCFLWGVVLSLIMTPLGWGPSGGHAPPSPEPRAPMSRQFTEPKTLVDSRGTLPTTVGEVLCNFKLAGNANKFWAHLGSGKWTGGATRESAATGASQGAAPADALGTFRCPAHQAMEGSYGQVGTVPHHGVHPGWPGWFQPPGVPRSHRAGQVATAAGPGPNAEEPSGNATPALGHGVHPGRPGWPRPPGVPIGRAKRNEGPQPPSTGPMAEWA